MGFAVAGGEAGVETLVTDLEYGVGEAGEFFGDFGEPGEAKQVASEDAEEFPAAEARERDGFDAASGMAIEFIGERGGVLFGRAGAIEVIEAGEPVGVFEAAFGEKARDSENLGSGPEVEGVGEEEVEGPGGAGAEGGEIVEHLAGRGGGGGEALDVLPLVVVEILAGALKISPGAYCTRHVGGEKRRGHGGEDGVVHRFQYSRGSVAIS